MSKRMRLIALALLVGGGLFAYNLLATRSDGGGLVFSGTVEAVEVSPSFQVAGRIATLDFSEGGAVTAGQVLGTLDAAELSDQLRQAEAALASARARLVSAAARAAYQESAVAPRVAAARAALDRAKAGLRPQEVERARQAAAEAEARASEAADEAHRSDVLLAAGAVAQARRDSALRAAEAARAALRAAQESLALAQEGTRREDLDAAQATLEGAQAEEKDVNRARADVAVARRGVEQSEADLALARTRLSRATLLSPLTGVVLTRAAEVGEMAGPGAPVAVLADTSLVTVRIFVSERQMGRVTVGMPARVTTDSTGKRAFAGRVSFVSAKSEFTPKTVETREERVKLVYRVKVEVPNPDGALKPGMPADVDLEK